MNINHFFRLSSRLKRKKRKIDISYYEEVKKRTRYMKVFLAFLAGKPYSEIEIKTDNNLYRNTNLIISCLNLDLINFYSEIFIGEHKAIRKAIDSDCFSDKLINISKNDRKRFLRASMDRWIKGEVFLFIEHK